MKTDTVRDKLLNMVEHLAFEETDTFLRRWWRPKSEPK